MSTWGARNGLPGYDEFRTGLTFREVKRMMFDSHTDRSRWKYKRRHTVLGAWHDLKQQLYWADARRAGRAEVEGRVKPWLKLAGVVALLFAYACFDEVVSWRREMRRRA